MTPTMLEELCKRIQHCCATLRRQSRSKRNVGSCWLKSLTGFELCATTRNSHLTTCKRTQHITSNNVGICWPKILHPFARGLTNNIIIIIPLFTLGSVYSTYAIGAEQMAETNHSNIIKHNRVKNPNWPEANQLAIYKPGQELF